MHSVSVLRVPLLCFAELSGLQRADIVTRSLLYLPWERIKLSGVCLVGKIQKRTHRKTCQLVSILDRIFVACSLLKWSFLTICLQREAALKIWHTDGNK